MPVNDQLATRVWARYAYCRDNGHLRFVEKADKCERFFAGDQWEPADRAKLRQQRRPALTINKILSTLSTVMGEQIYNRAEIAFRPRGGAPDGIAEALTKVFKQISDNNQLPWLRSDVFADGIITSRGFFDVRAAFDDSMQGEVRVTTVNPKNVIPDPDAEEYDPDSWNDVFITKWMTPDDIAVLYNPEDAELLRSRGAATVPYGFDALDRVRGRFGDDTNAYFGTQFDESSVIRSVRVVERQYRTMDKQKHFVSPETGDMRPIPENFDRERIAMFVQQFGFQVITKLVNRIKWVVVADNIVLHDEWSPYKHFTIVPYFPYFRHGTTIGLVENLLGPQELLNKVTSQELHVVNTTANSGWIIRSGSLVGMSVEELEQRGAETGLVVQVQGQGVLKEHIDKITPNQVPTGLDRLTFKAEEHIKGISGVGDSMQGMDREDVAAKAIQAKRQAGSTNFAKPMDSLVRTDYLLARNILDCVQEFYTEPRLITITKDRVTGQTETVGLNQPTPEGYIINDLTLGEYDVIVSSVPQRETLEDSQFEQAISMRQEGINIPDDIIIDSSRLIGKRDIIARLNQSKQDPNTQFQQAQQQRLLSAEADKAEGEAAQKHADAQLKTAKAAKETVATQKDAMTPIEADNTGAVQAVQAQHSMDMDEQRFNHERQMDFAKHMEERRKNHVEEVLQAHDMAEKRAQERADRTLESANSNHEGASS